MSRISRQSLVRWAVCSVSLAILLSVGVLAAGWRARSTDAWMRERLLQQAVEIAQAIDPDIVQALAFSPADAGAPAFERLRGEMIAYGRLLSQRGIYSLALRDGQLVFGPENYAEDDPMASPPGTVYLEPGIEDFAIFETGRPYTVGPETDEYGSFVSALAPVRDPNSGQVLMVVGLDITADTWQARVSAARRTPLLFALALGLIVLGFVIGVDWRERLPSERQSRYRHLETILVGVCGLCLVFGVTGLVVEIERREQQLLFEKLAETRTASIRATFRDVHGDVSALVRFFQGSVFVNRQEFAAFAGPMARVAAVRVYGWAPAVPAAQAAQSEAEARRAGVDTFAIWEPDASGARLPATGREVFYPIAYVEPEAGNETILGFDLGSGRARQQALISALRTGRATASEPIPLLDDAPSERGMLIVQPVFAGGDTHPSQLLGFAVGGIRLQSAVESAMQRYADGPPLVAVALVDLQADSGPVTLATYPSGPLPQDSASVSQRELTALPSYHVHPLFVYGRALAIISQPTPAFGALRSAWAGWLTSVIGLCLIAIVTAFVGSLRQRQERLAQEVQRRLAELRASEGQLRQSQAKLLSIFSAAPVGVGMVIDCVFQEANDALCQMTGYTHDELVGQNVRLVYASEEGYAFVGAEKYRQIQARGVGMVETHWRHKDGHVMDILLRSAALDPDNLAEGITFTALDITERKEAEEALRESEERYQRISEMISDYAYAFRVEPDGALRREWIVGGFERTTGFTPDESDARGGWAALIHPDDKPIAQERARRLFGGEQDVSEFRIVHRNGNVRWIRDHGYPVWDDTKNRIARIYGAAEDITARKRAEEERLEMERRLLQSQKLESLGVLAGGIAHDFNNLLMAVLGNLDLALGDVSPVSAARETIAEASAAARRAADLTRQLLAYAGKGRFIIRQVDLSALVQENTHLLRTAIARITTFSLHLASDLPTIQADPGQIQQVIMNLITNAAEAIGEQPGVITIATGVDEHDAEDLRLNRLAEPTPPGRYVYVEVTDTGCGMDEATQQRIFEPFYTTKFTGRGLGMSAVEGVVRGHGGAILVQSAVGQGSTIRVLFPVTRPTTETADAVDRAPMPAKTPLLHGTVLVVDDEPSVRRVCSTMLQRMGLEVLEAADGQEAIDLFREDAHSIDAVVLDLSMPRMDGLTALQELRRIDPSIKVLLSSGYSEQEATQRLTGEGAAGFIQKPYQLASLRAELFRVLGKDV